MSDKSVWSPDGKKFWFFDDNTSTDYNYIQVYNFKEPLPVGEKVVNETLKYKKDVVIPNIYWYSDSEHLILADTSSIKIINIDGFNMFELFSGNVIDSKAYPAPAGDRIIISSKFKSDAPQNLYTISIR